MADPMDTRRCRATSKRSGERCKRAAIIGGTVCSMHGGNIPKVRAAAKRRHTDDLAREVLGTIDPDAANEHPVETLLMLIQQKRAEVLWLRQIVKEHDEQELIWGTAEHRSGMGPEGPVDIQTSRSDQNTWWRLLREAENQLATWTAAAAKAGIDERYARLNEQNAGIFVNIANRLLVHLQLGAAAERDARAFLATAFREIDSQGKR